MFNTKNSTVSIDNLNFLVIGDIGTGKSCFASTFPTPAFLFDLDKQATVYREQEFDAEQFDMSNLGWIAFEQVFSKILQDKIYKTIIIDSLTALQDLAMERALALNPKRSETGGALWQIHYGLVKNLIEGVTRRLICYPGYKVVTAHIAIEKDELTGYIFAQPLIVGNLSERLPGYFGEVLYASERTIDNKKQFVLQTVNQGYYHARSNLSGKAHLLDDFIPNDFNSIMKMIENKQKILKERSVVVTK